MTRVSLRTLLQGAHEDVVREAVLRWCGTQQLGKGRECLAQVANAMEQPARVQERIALLPRKLANLLEAFLGAKGPVRTLVELFAEQGKDFKGRLDLEATLAALQREGFVWLTRDKRWSSPDGPVWAAPSEWVQCVATMRRHRQHLLQETFTLQGYLDARLYRERVGKVEATDSRAPAKAAEAKAAEHARKIYKLYAMEQAIEQRIGKLPSEVRLLLDGLLMRHGGMAAWQELAAEAGGELDVDFALAKKSLEENLLGLGRDLDLAPLGIQPAEQALVIFHEVALQQIKLRATSHRPTVSEELCCGGDFPSNVTRFLRELQANKVLFTAEGDLFKASQKRIAGLLLTVPGGLLSAEQLLELLYRFCLHRRLIDRRGERSLRPTPGGVEFERATLAEQIKMLLAHFIEDRTLPGEAYHQTRMRRVLLRLLRRAEPLQWSDLSVLPFLARNVYLSQLEAAPTEEYFAARFQGGGYTPSESLQQMAWNLLVWVKKRLFPLGIVDLGMQGGRPTALRLSRLGAELLDAEPAGRVGGTRSTLIVQPDFEVLVFPGDDVHDVVHQMDRFARRTKSDHIHQFRIDQASVRAGLDDGLTGAQIVQELVDRARVPVPQNVLYSLEEWAS